MGEPVYQFIRRLRLEKSAGLLLTTPRKSITEIALMCGFSTSSSFAKSFKNHFRMSATEWRNKSNNFFDKESTPIQIERGQISVIKGSPGKEDILKKYEGLHLVYANQCPYFLKSVNAIEKISKEYDIDLKILEISNAKEAQQAPSIYGVFSLIYNGALVAEHYISEKRFRNILEKELKIQKIN